MKWVRARVVDGLEFACRATRFVEWLPGWYRVYPRCQFARWSSDLDYRWETHRWAVHDADGEDAWDEWWEGLGDAGRAASGHWHYW